MQMECGTRVLTLAETFTIARGSSDVETVVWVAITSGGLTGFGEGAPDERYGETPERACDEMRRAESLLGDDPFALEQIERRLRASAGSMVALRAIEGALHDLVGKLVGQPTWRLLGLAGTTPETSFTLGIASIDSTVEKAHAAVAAGYRRLKIKVGGADDLARLEAIRGVCELPIRVDANEGWTLEAAREILPELRRFRVELIEQPFPAADRESFHALRELAPGMPIVVDEGCHTLADVAGVAGYADGINIKLDKTGGIREAIRMVHAARALGLTVMLGCMIESSLGISAAAQLASLCDFVDLDGHLLLRDDPFSGLGLQQGRIVLSQRPGLGVEER